jgi:hypothetical protein
MNRNLSIILCIGLLVVGLPFCLIASCTLDWFSEAATVAQNEFGPREALRKYTYLKAVASQLTAKKQSLDVLANSLKQFKLDYSNKPISDWPRVDKETYRQKQSEFEGLKLSYNNLVGEYDQLMSQFNWKFASSKSLPFGADEVLPGEGAFTTYLKE